MWRLVAVLAGEGAVKVQSGGSAEKKIEAMFRGACFVDVPEPAINVANLDEGAAAAPVDSWLLIGFDGGTAASGRRLRGSSLLLHRSCFRFKVAMEVVRAKWIFSGKSLETREIKNRQLLSPEKRESQTGEDRRVNEVCCGSISSS